MELSCAEVPLYGQVTVCAKFDKNIYLPEDAEFYFIYDGSTHRHIMFAERLSDNTLRSIAPGHGSQETVSVTVCMFTMGYSPVTVGCGAVTYAQDTASMLSNYLLGQAGVLMSDSHCAVRDQFGLTEENLRSLDHRLMLAMSHTDLPMPWSVREKNSDGEPIPQESLLHLSMRWGLEKLSRFLVSLPGGTSALTLSNGDGETPLDLAAHNGHTRLADLFANFQEVPGSDFATARLGDSAFLRFEEPSGVLSLTFNHTSEHTLEDDIKLFRKCFWDKTFRNKVLKLNTAEKEVLKMHSYVADTEEDSTNLISRGSSSENEDVESCQEPFLQLSENENQTGPATDLEAPTDTFSIFQTKY